MKNLAKLILETSKKADEAWSPEAPGMLSIIARCCPDTPEGELVCLLLQCCWNDAIDWANKNITITTMRD